MSEENSLSSNVITSEFIISSDGVASGYTFTNGGKMVVQDGGIASGNTVGYSGHAVVYSGGTAENTVLVSKGALNVYSDGVANGTVVGGDGRGNLNVSGTVYDTIILQSGSMVVAPTGAAYATIISSGGKIIVNSNGSVTDTVVENGGSMMLSSGSLANHTVVNNGGYLSAGYGTQIQDLTLEDGASAYLGTVTVSGAVSIAAGAVVTGGSYVLDYSNRSTESTWVFEDLSSISYSNLTLNFSGDQESGRYRIADGAENFTGSITVRWANRPIGSLTVGADPITKYGVTVQLVNEGDELYIEVFGLNNQVFSSGGNTIINTISNTTIVSGGSVNIVSGGAAYDTEIIGPKAYLYLRFDGSYAENTVISSGGLFSVLSGAVASNTVVSSGNMYIRENGSAVDTELIGKGANMHISSGGHAENITVGSGASVRLYSGTLGGTLNIESGASFVADGTFLFDLAGKDPRNSFFINNYTFSSFDAQYKIQVADDQAAGRYFLGDGVYAGSTYIDDGTSSGVAIKANSSGMVTVGNYGYFLHSGGGVMTLNVFDLSKGSSTIDSETVVSGKMENVFIQPNTETGSKTIVHVVSGGEINYAVTRQATIRVSSGGVIRNLTQSTGVTYLSSGAAAETTDVLTGTLYVQTGATADNTAVFSNGTLNVKNGTVNTVDVYNRGKIYLAGISSTIVNDMTLHQYGIASADLSASAVINDFTAKAYASATFGSNTVVSGNVSIDRNAYVYGGNYCFDFTAGTEYELSGLEYWQGVNITVKLPEYQSDAVYRLSETAGTFTGTITIDGIASISNGNAYFNNGKVYRAAQDDEGLYIEVLSGYSSATVSGSSYNSDGYIYYNDIKVTDQNISGYLNIYSGGIALNNTISGGLCIYDGGTASNTVLASGSMYIEVGSAIDTTLSSGGRMHLYSSGAVADGVTVLSGGSVIYSSGAISNAVFSSGAVMSAYFSTYTSRLAENFTNITLHSGAIINNMTIEQDSFSESGFKISGVTASNRVTIYDGMEVTDLTVVGGYTSVYGGTVNNLIMSSGSATVSGYTKMLGNGVTTYKTGVVNGAEVYGDYTRLNVYKYGEVNDVNIYSGAYMSVGGIARRTTVYSGASIYISGKVYDTELRGGFASLGYSSGTAKNTKIYSGGAMLVSNGNTVNDTTIYDGGLLYVDSRATANDTVISSGGLLFLRVSAYADGVVISSGGAFGTTMRGEAVNVTVHSGGNFLGFTLNEERTFDHVYDSAMRFTLSGATVGAAARFDQKTNPGISLPNYPIIQARVGDGGVITDTLVSGTSKAMAYLHIAIDGYADSTTVASRARMSVSSGGSADNTVVNRGGDVSVLNGGVASDVIVNSGGYVYVSAGGSATIAYNPWGGSNYGKITNNGSITYLERDANIYYGGSNHEFTVWDSKGRYISKTDGVFISKFDSADGFRVEKFNSAIVYSGGTLENVYVNYSGTLMVSSGGSAAVAFNPWGGTIQNDGGSVAKLARDAKVYYGGKLTSGFIAKWEDSAEGLEITSGNSALVYANGTLKDATVQSGGYLLVYNGATLTGTLNITKGAYVNFSKGSVFDFNLTERAADTDEFIINNLSMLKGTPNYTITVAENQQGGLYKLADNAGNFTGSITIGDGTLTYDSVTVNGTPLVYDTTFFSLYIENDELILNVLPEYNAKVFIYEGESLIFGGINMTNKTITSGRIMTVSSGGTVKNTILNGGDANILSGGIASATQVKAGTLSLTDGAIASIVNVYDGGNIVVDDDSSATKVILNGGSGSIAGNAVDVTVNKGATVSIEATGKVNNITVKAGGTANFATGSVITGKISVDEGANIIFADGSKIELDFNGRTTTDSFVITNLNAFTGTGDISVYLDCEAKLGRYSLAGAASGFQGSFTFLDENTFLGTVALNSPVAEFGDSKYILVEDNGNLYLDITRSQSAGGSSNDDWSNLSGEGESAFCGDSYVLSTDGIEISNWVGFGDSIDFIKVDLESAAKLAFDVTGTDNIKFSIYTLSEKNGVYSLNIVQNAAVIVKSDSNSTTVTTNSLMLQSGIYYISIESTNAAKGGDANYNISVNENSVFYTKGDNSDDWSDIKENGANGFTSTETISGSGELVTNGWVGYGDAIDYIKISLEDAAKLSFSIDADDAAKFTVYSFDEEKNTRNALQSGSLKLTDGKYVLDTAGLLLAEGTYYIGIESTNAAMGGDATYNISVNENSVFYNHADSSKSDDLSDFKTAGDTTYVKETLAVSTQGELVTGSWVGYGDAIDYIKISLEDAAKLSFSIDASDALKFTICEINEVNRGGVTSWSMKNLQTNTLKQDENGRYVIDTKELLLTAKEYYLVVQSTNAAKGGNAEYNISVNDSTVFFNQDNDGNNWTDLKEKGGNSLEIGNWTPFSTSGDSAEDIASGWVGFNDEVDYLQLSLENSAKLSFTVKATDAVKFVIYTLEENVKKGTYSLKALQTSTLKLDKKASDDYSYVIDTKSLLLNSELTYYIGISSTDAKKGGDASYEITVNADDSVIFSGGNNEDDTFDGIAEYELVGTITNSEDSSFTFIDWVGMGDETDFAKFTVDYDTKVNFTIDSSDDVKVVIYKLDEKGELKQLQTTNSKAGKITFSKDVALEAGVTYYMSVTSTNAKKGGSATFSVTGKAAGKDIKINGVSDDVFETIFASQKECSCDEDNSSDEEHYANCITDPNAKTEFIYGTPGNDKLTFEKNKSRFVNGIALGDGNDVMKIADSDNKASYDLYMIDDGSEKARYIDFADGNDQLVVGKNNCLDAAELISFGDGDDKMEIADNAKVFTYTNKANTGLTFGDGNDTLTIAKNGYLYGVPDFGGGNDTLKLEGALRLDSWKNDISLEKVTGKGYLLLSHDENGNLSASESVIKIFEDAKIKIVNTISDNVSSPEKELADNTAAKATALTANSEGFNLWLCGEELASSVEYGMADTADFIKFTKNNETGSLEFDIEGGLDGIIVQRVDAKGNEVLAEYNNIAELGNVISLSELANGTHYFKISVADDKLVYGNITLK